MWTMSARYIMKPAMYTCNWVYVPLTNVGRLSSIGKTSFTLTNEVYPTGSPYIILNQNITIGIAGDPITRKPVELPQYVRDVFDSRQMPPAGAYFVYPPLQMQTERPRDSHVVKIVAAPSDHDEYHSLISFAIVTMLLAGYQLKELFHN